MMNKYRLIILCFFSHNCDAVEFMVNTSDDTIDASLADGLCLDINNECSLRAAVMQSNILGTVDVIYLQRGVSYMLTLVDTIDTQDSNDLDIFDSLTISVVDAHLPIESLDDMPGIFVSIDGAIDDRVFEIHAGEFISFNGLFIAQGRAAESLSNPRRGGGVYVADQVVEFQIKNSIVAFNQAGYGAGIYSDAQSTVIESTDISYNTINIPDLITLGAGGAGVYHGGSELIIEKSSIHQNFVDEIGFFLSALHLNGEDSEVVVLNTLIADNGIWPSGTSGVVNGIRSNHTNLRMNNSNITGNSGVGINFLSDDGHELNIRNSVLAFNILDDCGELSGDLDLGSPSNHAHIISSDLSCSLPDLSGNIQNVDPSLSDVEGRITQLDFNFFSHQFPLDDSVLIDAGSPLDVNSGHLSACETTDILGVSRPLNGGLSEVCDVGVFESGDLIFHNGFELID